MDEAELIYHLENLAECDPNYVVDVLGITSEQLVRDYRHEAIEFLLEDQG